MLCCSCGEPTTDDPCESCGEAPLLDGRYRLETILGHGPQGTTFRAVSIDDGTTVVVKELPYAQALKDEKAKALFERETRVLRQLEHPSIPRYLDDFVTRSGRHRALCLVQEFIEGTTLADEARDSGHTFEDVLDILEELLHILVYLHALSPPVVHRDIKPNNVMRREDGRLVLVDFGSVRDVLADPDLGGSTVAGTFGYMAPEQYAGEATPRSDLYGVGALAVALLTGLQPRDLQDHDNRLHWEADVGAISPGFLGLLRGLLHPDPTQRPESAASALDWTARVRSGAPPEPPPRSAWGAPLPALVVGGILVVLAGLFAAGALNARLAAMSTGTATAPGRMLEHLGPEPPPGTTAAPSTYNSRANAEVVIPSLGALSSCVAMAPPRRANRVTVKLKVRPNGTVHASSVNMTQPNLILDRCVWSWLEDLSFPRPLEERPEVWFTLRYDPEGER
jgi:hypothetical protein